MTKILIKIAVFLPVVLIFQIGSLLACEVCKRNQPDFLQDITHGVGPQQEMDNLIVGGATLLVLVVLFYSVKLLWKPKEQDHSHIKYLIKDF
jgi:hypothetical protein